VPERIHPYSSGFWGGLAGGAAMAALACFVRRPWPRQYLVFRYCWPEPLCRNLGNASAGTNWRAFNGTALPPRSVGHGVISILVGVLYAVMLPMFPKYAVRLGRNNQSVALERNGGDDPGCGESSHERAHQFGPGSWRRSSALD